MINEGSSTVSVLDNAGVVPMALDLGPIQTWLEIRMSFRRTEETIPQLWTNSGEPCRLRCTTRTDLRRRRSKLPEQS